MEGGVVGRKKVFHRKSLRLVALGVPCKYAREKPMR
jgi:hypothetical protein